MTLKILSGLLTFAFALTLNASPKIAEASPSITQATEKTLQEKLNFLMSSAKEKGIRAEFQQFVNYYYQKGTSFDTTQNRSVQYLSIIGAEDLDGVFYPQMISTVSEVWTQVANGAWEIQQKLREVTLDGRIYTSIEQVLVLSAEGRVLETRRNPTIDANVDAESFETEINLWYIEAKN